MNNIFKVPGFVWIGRFVRADRRLKRQMVAVLGRMCLAPMSRRRPRPVQKILCIRLDRIGDMVLTTPAFRALRLRYPEARIDVQASAYTRPVLANNPHITRVVVDGVDLLDTDYDLAIAFHPGWRQNLLTSVSGAFRRIGYSGRGGSSFLTDPVSDDRATRVRHEVESALELTQLVGCAADDTHLDVFVSGDGERFADEFFKRNDLAGKRVVVIHPGSRARFARWSAAGFAAVADGVQKSLGCPVVLLGGPAEQGLVNAVARTMTTRPISLTDAPLAGVISVLKRACVFVGNSTGPMHLAAGVGTAVVAIFGARHPLESALEWGPWSGRAMVVQKNPRCLQCQPWECRTLLCMEMVTVDDVYEAVKTQTEKYGN